MFTMRRNTITQDQKLQVVNFWPDRIAGVVFRNAAEALRTIPGM